MIDPPTDLPRGFLAGRSPDRREAARRDGTRRNNKTTPARSFELAHTTVVVSETLAGIFARIERGTHIEYAVLAQGTVEAVREVAHG